jgi:hypothetical protein
MINCAVAAWQARVTSNKRAKPEGTHEPILQGMLKWNNIKYSKTNAAAIQVEKNGVLHERSNRLRHDKTRFN